MTYFIAFYNAFLSSICIPTVNLKMKFLIVGRLNIPM